MFLELMIANNRFQRNAVLVLDNAPIHGGAESRAFKDMLWNYPNPNNGEPMNVAVLFLPTRSPELNPIELIFSVLASRLRQTRYCIAGDANLPATVGQVLMEISPDIYRRMATHCGYRLNSE